ncbi:MAG TPA: MMPL family transporter [Solirubrobacterales bacterium]|jgi:RND superfamily putative drug exporter
MLGRLYSLATGRRSRWAVIVAWVAVAAALLPLHSKLQAEAEDESDTFLVRGSQSAEVDRLLDERFDFGSDVATVIVYDLPDGGDIFRYGERINEDARALCREGVLPDVRAVITPFELACGDISQSIGPETGPASTGLEGDAAITTVLTTSEDTERVVANVETIREVVAQGLEAEPELRAYVTGQGGFDADRARAVEGINETLMTITAILIITLLLAIYRSPVAAAVPLLVVGVAYFVAAGITWGLVSAGLTSISGQTTAILIVLMFGAGTDYCLLLVSRYREELAEGAPPAVAVERAARPAGATIVTSGSIVIAAMLALALADFNATREMGPILALGVAVTLLASLTLLPAVLAALGRWTFWLAPRARRERPGLWARAARLVQTRPVAVAAAVTAVLVAGCLGNLGGRETLTFADQFRGKQPDSVRGQEVIRAKFPPGRAAPLDLVLSQEISGPVISGLNELDELERVDWSAGSGALDEDPEVPIGELVLAEAHLRVDPLSDRARDQVPGIRAELDRLVDEARAGVTLDEEPVAALGGFAAESYDTAQAMRRDALIIVPVALLVILAIMFLVFRALITALYVVVTVILSFGCALGLSSLAFTHLLGQPASDPSLAIFAFIFLVGLGVDYNVFLLGRIREERERGLSASEAVGAGLRRTGGVITGAGLILAGTFGALMALELEALFQVGFAVALGLLIDTFLVRALLVPAIAVWLGDRAWRPTFSRFPAKAV